MAHNATNEERSPALVKGANLGSMLNMPTIEDTVKGRRRLATVYDAVAGNLSHEQPLRDDHNVKGKEPVDSTRGSQQPTRETPYAPDEVLFRRKDAPERYAEYDLYHSHERDLPDGGRRVLPESDLLKSIHGYSSRFYGALDHEQRHQDRRNLDWRGMDETALLTFGILLEEAGRELLGRRGDLVFTETAEASDGGSGDEVARRPEQVVGYQDAGSSKKAPKRRRTDKSEDPAT